MYLRNPRLQLALWLLVITAAVTVYCHPLLQTFWIQTHDWEAYPVRVLEYVRGWRDGFIYPRWAPDLYGGYGAPFFNYYAPGLFAAAGLFVMLGVSATVALKSVIVLVTIVGTFAIFLLAKRGTSGEARFDSAAVAAAVFLYMPYRLTQLYWRGDIAEYAAICLVPVSLLVYATLLRSNRNRFYWLIPVAAAAHASVIFTHTIIGQWYTQLVVIISLISLLRAPKLTKLAWIGAFTAALALTSIYTIPALLERPYVDIESLGRFGSFKRVTEILCRGFFYGGRVIPYALVAAPVLVLAFRFKRGWLQLAAATAAAAIPLFLVTPDSELIWRLIPFHRFTQFAWRLFGFVAVFGALLIGREWSFSIPRRWFRWVLVVVSCWVIWKDDYIEPPNVIAYPESKVPADAGAIATRVITTTVLQEYLPRGATCPSRPRDVVVEAMTADDVELKGVWGHGPNYSLAFHARAPAQILIKSFWFPGMYLVNRGGGAGAMLTSSQDGLLKVSVPGEGDYQIRIKLGLTRVQFFATAVSVTAACGLLALLGIGAAITRRHRKTV